MAAKTKLTTMLGTYPNTTPLKSGAVKSDLVDFDFADVKVANNHFKQLVRDGELDAAVVGDKLPDPRLKYLIPDPETASKRWAERHHGVAINHMVVVRSEISKSRPDVVRDIFQRFHDSKRAAGLADGGPLDPY